MKIFDRDGDGDFDVKDFLLMTTVITTFMNLVLNVFAALDLGVTLTNKQQPVLDCKVVQTEEANKLKCFKAPNGLIPLAPPPIGGEGN